MNIYNKIWLGGKLRVISSPDVTLIGRNGVVVDETKNTLTIQENGKGVKLGKSSIRFTIDDSEVIIDGAMVGQRPENRVHKKYRMG